MGEFPAYWEDEMRGFMREIKDILWYLWEEKGMEGPVELSCRNFSVQDVHNTQCFSLASPKPQMSRLIDNWRCYYTDHSVKMICFGCYHVWLNMSYKRIDSGLIYSGVFRISVTSWCLDRRWFFGHFMDEIHSLLI